MHSFRSLQGTKRLAHQPTSAGPLTTPFTVLLLPPRRECAKRYTFLFWPCRAPRASKRSSRVSGKAVGAGSCLCPQREGKQRAPLGRQAKMAPRPRGPGGREAGKEGREATAARAPAREQTNVPLIFGRLLQPAPPAYLPHRRGRSLPPRLEERGSSDRSTAPIRNKQDKTGQHAATGPERDVAVM